MPSPPPAESGAVEIARAKLNLDLILTGRRPNGYHELDSVVAFADVGDLLSFAPADELRVDCTGPFAADLPHGDGNIVRRAALRLAEAAEIPARAAIRLEKRLPVASGIGGGSADAAAALRGLARMWRIPPDAPLLTRTALALGSDVLACLGSRSARMRGIGEVIEPLPSLPRFHLVLANPNIALSTPAVFALVEPDLFGTRPGAIPASPDLAWLLGGRNDLEVPARRLLPMVDEVLAALADLPGCRVARMSGTGSTCFGVFDDGAAAGGAADRLARSRPDWWVAPCTVGEPPA